MQEKFLQLFGKPSSKMFYILGLIFGDGCVHYNIATRKYYVNLTSQDLDILENFRNFIGKKYQIKKIENANAFAVNVWSKPLCEVLFSLYQLRNKKSHKLVYPNVPTAFEKFFILGIHATDGSNPTLTIKKNYKNKLYINYTLEWNYTSCSKNFIHKINEVVSRNLNIKPAKINVRLHKVGNTSYSIRYFGKRAQSICDWMYDCPIWMRCDRKYKMYQSYQSLREIVRLSN